MKTLSFNTLVFLLSFNLNYVNGQDLLNGFKVLDIPRSNIPIGSVWIDGVGPDGNGVRNEQISKSESLSNLGINSDFKQKLDISILNFLKIDGDFFNLNDINYKNLSIYKVKDLSKVNIRSGQQLLYEAIKADSISVNFNKNIEPDVAFKLNEKLKLSSSTDYTKTVTFSGEKLFLAYRVFELGTPIINDKTKNISLKEDDLKNVTIRNLEFKFDFTSLNSCSIRLKPVEIRPRVTKMRKVSYLDECEKEIPISVSISNLNDVSISGDIYSQIFDIYNDKEFNETITKREGNIIVTTIVSINIHCYNKSKGGFYSDNVNSDNENVSFVPREFVKNFKLLANGIIKIKTIKTPLKTMKNPKASGW